MVRAGIIGLGFMGRMHFNTLRTSDGVKVTALCDIDPEKRAGGWLNIRGNIEDSRADGQVDVSNYQVYEDGLDLIANPEINTVVITTPTFLHAKYAVAALEAGKDVIVEKPIALDPRQADTMLDAANASGRLLLVGQCVRFWPDYTVARDIIRSKAYGKVKSAFFRRIGGAPVWCWEGWYLDGRRSGGALLDLHVHDIDYIQNCFGIPREVSSAGTIDVSCNNGAVDHVITQYLYPDGPAVTAQGSWYIGSVGFEMSFIISLEHATLVYNSQTGTRLTIHLPDGSTQQPPLPEGDGYSQETSYFLDCMVHRTAPALMPPVEARNNIAIACAERESIITGKPAPVNARA